MTPTWYLTHHDNPELVRHWLSGLGVRDPERGARDLADLTRPCRSRAPGSVARIGGAARHGPAALSRSRHGPCRTRAVHGAVPRIDSDARRAGRATSDDRDPASVFSTSQYFSEVLIRDPGAARLAAGGAERPRPRGPDRRALDHRWTDRDRRGTAGAGLRRFRQRESLRIGYNDIVRGFPLEVITLDLSDLADACVEAAVAAGAVARRGSIRRALTAPTAAPPGSSYWGWVSSAARS